MASRSPTPHRHLLQIVKMNDEHRHATSATNSSIKAYKTFFLVSNQGIPVVRNSIQFEVQVKCSLRTNGSGFVHPSPQKFLATKFSHFHKQINRLPRTFSGTMMKLDSASSGLKAMGSFSSRSTLEKSVWWKL